VISSLEELHVRISEEMPGRVAQLAEQLTLNSRIKTWRIAFLISYLMTNDSIGTVLRKCRITHRTTRPSLWHDVFHKYDSHYVVVELGDGRVALGWVEFYSDFPSAPSLFLNDACWIDSESGERRQIDGPGILISGEIKTISFHTPKDIRRSPDKSDSTADVLGSTAQATRTDKIYRHPDRRWFIADRRGYCATLGKNSPGTWIVSTRRIRRYQNRCWTQEHPA
jgi:Family of unknown function (DUF6338)